MKRIISTIFIFSCAIFSVYSQKFDRADADNSLSRLDYELDRQNEYIGRRISMIDSLRNLVKPELPVEEVMRLQMELGNAYNGYNTDSALYYFFSGSETAARANDRVSKIVFSLKRATILPLAGFTEEAQAAFESIDRSVLPDSLMPLYYESGRQLYSYVAAFYEHYPEISQRWQNESNRYRDLYLSTSSEESALHRLNLGESLFDEGKYSAAKSILTELVGELPDDSNLYARGCHILAMIADIKGDDDEAVCYLAMSAIADIKGAILEVMSLQELGAKMSRRGSINRAYKYLSGALSNAVDCHAMMRISQASASLPLIQKAHSDQIDNWRNKIYIFIVLLGIILVGLMGLLFYLHRQMKQMADLQNNLVTANQVKEVYISQFFRLCSIYIDKLNQFCKIANRKISAGQVDELYKITKSGKLVDEQSQEFYQLFDDAFLHIYPTFVKDVNKLLREKIVLKEGEALNNDLRILAFMRLGLEDTNQVAQILNYSVNTIYAYRNKLRNRAFNRETFEADVMRISSI